MGLGGVAIAVLPSMIYPKQPFSDGLGGVTQTQLAELLKVNQAFISKIETCERRLDIIELHHICQVLGISFVDFIQEVDRDILCKNEEESYITIKELKK